MPSITDDTRIQSLKELIAPSDLLSEIPLDDAVAEHVTAARRGIHQILSGQDDRLVVVSFSRNFGQQPAYAAALDYVDGDAIVLMDGDLQDDPAEIPHLIKKLEDGYDLVSGWKKMRHDPWTKTVPSPRRISTDRRQRMVLQSTSLRIHISRSRTKACQVS